MHQRNLKYLKNFVQNCFVNSWEWQVQKCFKILKHNLFFWTLSWFLCLNVGATTLCITTFSMTTFSIKTSSMMSLSITTLSILQSIVLLSVGYSECQIQAFMQSVIMPSVVAPQSYFKLRMLGTSVQRYSVINFIMAYSQTNNSLYGTGQKLYQGEKVTRCILGNLLPNRPNYSSSSMGQAGPVILK